MAKELPFYRFSPAEWLTGKITLENFEMQGIFILICCYYWKSNCDMTRTELEKRLATKRAIFCLNSLINSKIIKFFPEKNKINIFFLDEQFEILTHIQEERKKAGRLGGVTKERNKH